MGKLHTLVFLLSTISVLEGITFPERWAHLKSEGSRCYFGVAAGLNIASADVVKGISHLLRKMAELVAKANCSLIMVPETDIGRPNATGSYNGLIGSIQRDQMDFGLVVVRTDALPYDPGKPTAPLYSADVAIISSIQGKETEEVNDIISFLDLDLAVVMYFFICLFFLMSIIMIWNECNDPTNINPQEAIHSYLNNCRIIFYMLMTQDQFSPRRLVGFILTLSISLFTLFGVNGILVSTVGANLVAKRSPPTIDTLDQLLLWPKITPTLVTNLLSWDAIKAAPPGTQLHKLKQRIDDKMPHSTITMDFVDAQKDSSSTINLISREIEKVNRGEKAFIMARAYGDYALDASCFTKGIADFSDRVHVSSESFAAGIFASLMSNKIHPFTEKILSNLFSTLFETGQYGAMWKNTLPEVPDLVGSFLPGTQYNSTTVQCLERTAGKKEDETFRPLTIRHMKGAFFLLLYCAAASSLVLAREILHKSAQDRRMKQKNSARSHRRLMWREFALQSRRIEGLVHDNTTYLQTNRRL